MTPPNTDYRINFYGNVSNKTKKTSQATLELVKQNVNLPEFFYGLEVNIGEEFKNIIFNNLPVGAQKIANDVSDIQGYAMHGDSRRCYISESMHKNFDFCSLFFGLVGITAEFLSSEKDKQKNLANTIAHEIGHLYNDYCVQASPEIETTMYNLLFKEDCTIQEHNFADRYTEISEISDSKEFKDALMLDLANVKPKDLENDDIRYFVSQFIQEENNEQTLEEIINNSNYCRGEVFAELFAYACGTDSDLKDFFTTKVFPNTYKFVQEYIKNPSKVTIEEKISLPNELKLFSPPQNNITNLDFSA